MFRSVFIYAHIYDNAEAFILILYQHRKIFSKTLLITNVILKSCFTLVTASKFPFMTKTRGVVN